MAIADWPHLCLCAHMVWIAPILWHSVAGWRAIACSLAGLVLFCHLPGSFCHKI